MPGELTEKKAEQIIRRELRDQDWTRDGIETIVRALEGIDGLWSYGTYRALKDLVQIYEGLEAEYGEPPDERL